MRITLKRKFTTGKWDSQREEDTGLCPRISGLGDSIHPESFERRQEHQANSPPMVQGEGEVQEDLVAKVSQLCALDIVVYLLFGVVISVMIRSKEN